MRRHNGRLDFSGQAVAVGIDVSKRSWRVAVLVGGYEQEVFSQAPKAEVLVKYLRRNSPAARYRCAYKARYLGSWIRDDLRKHGVECMSVNPADVPTKDMERRNRNDRVDARKRARGLANGVLSAIYVPASESSSNRRVAGTRFGRR
ncbi:MAG: hypothetical protein ACE5O2_09035 [Armatimonadota bacterium]